MPSVIACLRKSLGSYLPQSPNFLDINNLALQFIRRDLRHQTSSPDEVDHDLLTRTWIKEAYCAFNSLLAARDEKLAIATLDRISVEFGNAASLLAQLADDFDALRVKEGNLLENTRLLDKSIGRLRDEIQHNSKQHVDNLQRSAEQHAHDLQGAAEQHAHNLQRNDEQHVHNLQKSPNTIFGNSPDCGGLSTTSGYHPNLRVCGNGFQIGAESVDGSCKTTTKSLRRLCSTGIGICRKIRT